MGVNFQDLLPEYIQSHDRRQFIMNLMQAWQNNYYDIDSQIDGLLVITDVDDCPSQYLDYIAAMIGFPLLGIDSDEEKRVQIKNAVAFYKIKGTLESWHIVFASLGFDVTVQELWYPPTPDTVNITPGNLIPYNPRVEIPVIGRDNVTQPITARLLSVDLTTPLDLTGNTQLTVVVNGGSPTTVDIVLGGYLVAGDSAASVSRPSLIAALNAAGAGAAVAQAYPPSTPPAAFGASFLLYKTILSGSTASLTVSGSAAPLIFGATTSAVGADPPTLGTAASLTFLDTQLAAQPTITVNASTNGVWGNFIYISITDPADLTQDPLVTFDLHILFDNGLGPEEVRYFPNLTKGGTPYVDNVVSTVEGQTFYIDIESLATSLFRPANTGSPVALVGGVPPTTTKSPYVDITLSTSFLDPAFLNKGQFFDGRIEEVKAAHIRIRTKRIAISFSEQAITRAEVFDPATSQFIPLVQIDYDDSACNALVNAMIVDLLQPSCRYPVGAITVYFHNGFIVGRDGTYYHGYLPFTFDGGIPDTPPAGLTGVPGYVYGYDNAASLTYGTTLDLEGHQFIYGLTFDASFCDTDVLNVSVGGSGTILTDSSFYGVTVSQQPLFNGQGLSTTFSGYIPFDSNVFGSDTNGAPAALPDPENSTAIIAKDPVSGETFLVDDWRYAN
jgi:phage tail-like protein